LSLRLIWVAIRGINYTDQATRQVGANIDKLVQKQQMLRTEAIRMVMAGTMWITFAGLATYAVTRIMEKTVEGTILMKQFGKSMDALLANIGQGFVRTMGPTIKMLGAFFDLMAKVPAIGQLVAILGTLFITLLALKGVMMVITGLTTFMGLSFHAAAVGGMHYSFVTDLMTAKTLTLSSAFMIMRASLGPAVALFVVFYQIATAIGQYAPALLAVIAALTVAMAAYAAITWSAATALSILTFGIAAAVGVGAAIAAQKLTPTPHYQLGVRSVRQTQLAVVHEGEEIRSRRNVMYDRESHPRVTYNQITISTGDVLTKASKEELRPMILKTVKEAMDNKT